MVPPLYKAAYSHMGESVLPHHPWRLRTILLGYARTFHATTQNSHFAVAGSRRARRTERLSVAVTDDLKLSLNLPRFRCKAEEKKFHESDENDQQHHGAEGENAVGK